VRAIGNGRKERVAPLTGQTVAVLRVWMREADDELGESPLFPSAHGGSLTRDAIERRLAKHVASAERNRSTLRSRRVSMHVLRHTAAMTLLAAGVDTSTITLGWGTSRSALPTSTCTPISRPSNARWTASHRPADAPAAIGRPTR